jgi:hypothetical protein
MERPAYLIIIAGKKDGIEPPTNGFTSSIAAALLGK